MVAYVGVAAIKDALGGSWGASLGTGSGSSRDDVLAALAVTCSRLFDRACGVATNHFAPGVGITRRYSGSGQTYQDLADDWDAITAVTMTSDQAGTQLQTLTVTDKTSPNYAQVEPLEGPPYSRLWLLRTWLLDVYDVGNVQVTGTLSTPADVADAVAIWAAYRWKKRESGWANAVQHADGPGVTYLGDLPPEVKRVVDYWKGRLGGSGGPKLAVIGSLRDAGPRPYLWPDWLTTP